MVGVFLLTRLLERPIGSAQAIGLSALVLFLADPAAMFSVGTVLTFAAVCGIALFSAPIRERLPSRPEWLWSGLAGTLAAEAATAPVLFWRFNLVAAGAWVTSPAAIPLSAGLIAVGGALLLFYALGIPAGLLESLFALGLARPRMARGALDRSRVPAADASAVGNASGRRSARGRGARTRGVFRRSFAVSAAAVFGLCALRPGPSGPERGLSIEALDVGQGDAILLRWKRRAILVDGGGPFDVEATEFGRTRVLPKLLDRGVTRLDAVLLTHPHPDHALGLFAILEELPVGELWRSDGADEGGFHADLTALADRRGVPTRLLRTGDALELDGARISVLHSGGPMRKNDGVNNQSVVALVERDGRSALLTGDIGKPAEDALREAGAAPRADVLKVAHHGSRTSTSPAFLDVGRAEAGASLLRAPQPVRPSRARDSRDSRSPLRTAASDGHAVRLPGRASPRGDPAGLERPGETLSGESAGKPDLLVIVGPTGSGKTDLAHAVALAREGEIVSADAFAVYRGLDVGTAKPPPRPAVRGPVPHARRRGTGGAVLRRSFRRAKRGRSSTTSRGAGASPSSAAAAASTFRRC